MTAYILTHEQNAQIVLKRAAEDGDALRLATMAAISSGKPGHLYRGSRKRARSTLADA